jgi:hypothetical protein
VTSTPIHTAAPILTTATSPVDSASTPLARQEEQLEESVKDSKPQFGGGRGNERRARRDKNIQRGKLLGMYVCVIFLIYYRKDSLT